MTYIRQGLTGKELLRDKGVNYEPAYKNWVNPSKGKKKGYVKVADRDKHPEFINEMPKIYF